MNRTFLKVALRVIGTLSGLAGVAWLCFGFYLLFRAGQDAKGWKLAFSAFYLLPAGYLVYVAYLIWFRFSPLAVQHACSLIAICVIILLDPSHDSFSPLKSSAFLGCLIAIYFGYKAVSRWLSRKLFPDPAPAVQA